MITISRTNNTDGHLDFCIAAGVSDLVISVGFLFLHGVVGSDRAIAQKVQFW